MHRIIPWCGVTPTSCLLSLITGCELHFDLLVFFTFSIFNWTHHHKGQELFHFLCQAGFPVECAKDTPAPWVSGLPAMRILLSTKGAQESGVGGFLSPNMRLDLKIQLPGFFCLLVSMSASVYLGMCGRTLHEVCGWNWISFASSKICRLGTCFASRLVVFIKPYPVAVSQLSIPSVVCWTRDLLVVAVDSPTDFNPTNAAVTSNTSEASVSLWFPLDTATSNLGSQVAEVKETVPAGAGILPWVNQLHIWDPRAHEPHLQVILASFRHSKHGLAIFTLT